MVSRGMGDTLFSNYPELKAVCSKLEQKKHNLSFTSFCVELENAGFEKKSTCGSHHIYKHKTHKLGPPYYDTISVQNVKGKAKPYQIKQFLDFIYNAVPKENV